MGDGQHTGCRLFAAAPMAAPSPRCVAGGAGRGGRYARGRRCLAGGPAGTVVGRVDEFTPGQPVHLEDHAVWVVFGVEDRFVAFSDADPRIAGQHDCRVEWNPGRAVSGEQGVFETCTGYLFHPGGTTPVFWSVAASGPVFYSAEAIDGNVVVSLDEPYCNARFPYPGPCHSIGTDTIVPQPVIMPQED